METPVCKQPPCKKKRGMKRIEREDAWVFECQDCGSVQVLTKKPVRGKARHEEAERRKTEAEKMFRKSEMKKTVVGFGECS